MSHTNRKNKSLAFGLLYGCNPAWMLRTYAAEVAAMMNSMAVARNTGIGYICLEQPDFSTLELRLLNEVHDETQWTAVDCIEPERYYTRNQRGRHWDKQRRQPVVQKKQNPLEAMAFALHDQFMLERFGPYHNPVHQMAEVRKAPHLKSIACKIVEAGGKIELQKNTWYSWFNGDYKDYSF